VIDLPASDRIQGDQLLKELEFVEKEPQPGKRRSGSLTVMSKFSDLLAKHSALAAAVVNIIGKMMTGS